MKKIRILRGLVLLCFCVMSVQHLNAEKNWTANWITSLSVKNEANTWVCFRKEIDLKKVEASVMASVAADSKYWLWINGELVVFEGGLKRGPSPNDTYYDEVELSPYLKKGHNTIAVLLWYFGKEGFSHKSSGTAGLLFNCNLPGISINSDETWQAIVNPAYIPYEGDQPNYRIPESCICYDAEKDLGQWMDEYFDTSSWQPAKAMGVPPCGPWNRLVLRPIPLWKDYGLKDYENKDEIPGVSKGKPIVCRLPANIQITPWLKIETTNGQVIDIRTDHFAVGDAFSIQARYITKNGEQEYESLGWMNGEEVIYTIPEGVKILGLKYRETGFNTTFAGSFSCSDDFYTRLWNKAARTLYVTMRDTYMDCPERERAQWWGDEVNEGGEAFYAFDCGSHSLQKKGILELINWQKPDSIIFAPVPAGNWDQELPGQMLASVGYYGFWTYYLYSGDLQTISRVYDGVMRYLAVWQLLPDGTLTPRNGGWNWGDWGSEKDMILLQNSWYYLALKGARNMALALDKKTDANKLQQQMDRFKSAFNQKFWTGEVYRHPDYTGKTDDRSQALAVVSGLADQAKFSSLFELFKTTEFASPYMEKYVVEALFMMGKDKYALERLKRRFEPMVDDPNNSTLWEGWNINGGTTNHGWSGGGLTLLSQYVCGIAPETPGFKKIRIAPQPGNLESASAKVVTVNETVEASFSNRDDDFEMKLRIPGNTSAHVKLPFGTFSEVVHNGKVIYKDGKVKRRKHAEYFSVNKDNEQAEISAGEWTIKAIR